MPHISDLRYQLCPRFSKHSQTMTCLYTHLCLFQLCFLAVGTFLFFLALTLLVPLPKNKFAKSSPKKDLAVHFLLSFSPCWKSLTELPLLLSLFFLLKNSCICKASCNSSAKTSLFTKQQKLRKCKLYPQEAGAEISQHIDASCLEDAA